MNIQKIIETSPIIPVVVIENIEDALPLAKAIYEGGIKIMEVTLRSDIALEAIELISNEFPLMNVGAGTVCNEEDLINARNAGAKFVFSPGISNELIQASISQNMPLIPGVATASEVMMAQNNNIFFCKLFPATISGGVDLLKAFKSPFSKMKFCPTGGINLTNINEFLQLDNVLCVGGSWMVKKELIKEKNFEEIKNICKETLLKINK